MILPASYANGFAPRDGRPLYPELWRGCVGAWNSGLGPTGLTLRDWSGFGNHGTLTNMDPGTDWVTSQRQYALDVDGVNDYVTFGAKAASIAGPISVSVWVRRETLLPPGTNCGILAKGNIRQAWPGTSYCMSLLGNNPQNVVSWAVFDDTNNGRIGYYSSDGVIAKTWTHICGTYNGIGTTNSATQLYIAGVLKSVGGSEDAGTFVTMTTTTIDLEFGRRPYDGGYEAGAFQFDDMRIYSRVLSSSEIRRLASRRGIAYEMAPRRRSSSAVQFNRRRRLLVGAGS